MSKSVYEPKKIVKYNNTITPSGNIAGNIPPGPVSRPAVPPPPTPSPGPINQPITPPPPPPPTTPVQPTNPTPPVVIPGPGFGFEFDGNTSLTGSYDSRLIGKESFFSFYFEPLWGATDTGSFTVFHIGPDSGSLEDSIEVKFERTNLYSSYFTNLILTADSGGETKTVTFFLTDMYSSSLSAPQHYGVRFKDLSIGVNPVTLYTRFRINGEPAPTVGSSSSGTYAYLPAPEFLTGNPVPSNWKISLGRSIQDSTTRLPGRLDELVFFNGFNPARDLYNRRKKVNYNTLASSIKDGIYNVYTFDTDLSGSKGHSNLEVVGTETYYTGSFL